MSPKPTKGSFPRPDAETREAFDSLVPDHPKVAVRPMFGNVAAFVNGNMFTGVFGQDLFVRLSEGDREELIAEGGAEFQPMPGRAMKEYVSLPRSWRKDRARAGAWIERSLAWAERLPPKTPGRRRS
ncbi:MAG TPA: TfoX/Sxy family protein [Actinomycetota bacterium]|jgi:TfoX/Sxy family transcriptional regulator of competence genes|nr:TfoX/Sxy family protein [Actinomycetota bacterium]